MANSPANVPGVGATRPRTDRRRRPHAAAIFVAGTLALATWAGCSLEKHYDVLSFFFDGVPDPSLATVGVEPEGVRRVRPGATPTSAHTAYLERRCDECHGRTARFGMSVSGFSDLDARTCLKCHQDELTAFTRMHGPVAAGACLWCHQPHESPLPHLMKTPSPELCLACHEPQMTQLAPSSYHADLSRDCLECHHGHGGETPGLLRPGPPSPPATPAAPAPIPSEEGAGGAG